jgi:hypothetical protein
MAEDKKIIIDEDWKNQAQKEKEVLKEQQEAEGNLDKEEQQLLKSTLDQARMLYVNLSSKG